MVRLFIVISLIILTVQAYSQVATDTGFIVKTGDRAPNVTLKLTTGETIQLSEKKRQSSCITIYCKLVLGLQERNAPL